MTPAATHIAAVTFFCAGTPRPKGSLRYLGQSKAGKPILAGMGKGEGTWRACVSQAAHEAMGDHAPFDVPVSLRLEFFTPRPKGHYRKDGSVKPDAPRFPAKAPDWDKVARSVSDALNGIVYRDDALVVVGSVEKRWCDDHHPHAGVRVVAEVVA